MLTIAARVVGDAGRPQLREAGFTSAAIPTGALAAQAVFVTSVGRHQLPLSFGEEAPLHGGPIPELPSMDSQSLRSNRDPQDTLTCTDNIHHSCLTDLSVAMGRQRLSESVGRRVLRRGGQAFLRLSVAHLNNLVDTNLLPKTCVPPRASSHPAVMAVGLGWGTQTA